MNLYPLKFDPILKERLWGGTKLGDVFGKPIQGDTIGESWELSAVKGDVSVVANGALKGKSLQELIEEHPEQILGENVHERFGKEFPILIKFIDAKKDLSIQLHPNDDLAKKRHDSFGKTEMWYIMDADPGSQLIVGFNRDVTKSEYQESLSNGKILDLLNYENVSEGDTFFINTGKIHAIGAGVLLAEIQQTSDVTYRVFDFNRKDKDGNLRELHTELALDAIDYQRKDDFKIAYSTDSDTINKMVHCQYFKTDLLSLSKDYKENISKRDSFTVLMCVEGKATVLENDHKVPVLMGETVFLPASSQTMNISTEGCKLLQVTI